MHISVQYACLRYILWMRYDIFFVFHDLFFCWNLGFMTKEDDQSTTAVVSDSLQLHFLYCKEDPYSFKHSFPLLFPELPPKPTFEIVYCTFSRLLKNVFKIWWKLYLALQYWNLINMVINSWALKTASLHTRENLHVQAQVARRLHRKWVSPIAAGVWIKPWRRL